MCVCIVDYGALCESPSLYVYLFEISWTLLTLDMLCVLCVEWSNCIDDK